MSWFELRRGEFNIWAYGLQALSSGKSSLDYRVRNRSDVGGIILALLGGLSEDLEDCIKNGKYTDLHNYVMLRLKLAIR